MIAATPTGFIGTGSSLRAAAEWAQAMCHLVYGPVKGEAYYRRLPASAVLSLWARKGSKEGG